MEIRSCDYDANRVVTLQKLSEYYTGESAAGCSFDDMTKRVSFVLEQEGKVLGRVFGYIDHLTASIRIEGLIVEETARGLGVGRTLVDKIEETGRQKQCQIAFVDTTSSSAPKFYERLGYSLIGQIQDYPILSETYYFYMKRLSTAGTVPFDSLGDA